MSDLTRRRFLGSTVGSVALPAAIAAAAAAAPAAQSRRDQRLRVQFTPGGHTSPLQMYAMFEDTLFADVDPVVLPHPNAFDSVARLTHPT